MLPATLFIGQNLITLPSCGSTNAVLNTLASENNALSEGTVLITPHQTQGRGQRGNNWEAKAGENLTFSVLLKPTFLPVSHIFSLNIMVALAVREALEEFFLEIFLEKNTKENFLVKWANDILFEKINPQTQDFEQQKIAGILIENTLRGTQIQHSIIGIGININQMDFENPKATSLAKIISNKKINPNTQIFENTTEKITQKTDKKINFTYNQTDLTHNLEYILHKVLKHLEYYYLCIKKNNPYQPLLLQKSVYFQHLFQYNTWASYQLSNNELFFAKIIDITQEGHLKVENENAEIKTFALQEIKFNY